MNDWSQGNSSNAINKKLCCVCGSQDSTKLSIGLIKCDCCGFIWADIKLTSEELKDIYGKSYFFGEEYVDYLSEESILKLGFNKIEKRFTKLFPKPETKPKLLEIGSAYGFFLDIAKDHFQGIGVEISKDAVEYSRKNGHEVFQGELSEFTFQDKFDLIVSFATLEHILLPGKIIEQVYQLLKPNGYCYFTTIDICSAFARIRGKKWRMIHPPTHVSYFSSSTLKLLMERNGFRIEICKPIWQYRSINALFLPKFQNTHWYKLINSLGFTRIPVPFKFGDIIGLLAKKV
jgi:SAM-dependent methyltransferase